MKFSFVTIHVTELDPSIKFYEKVIGLKILDRFSTGPTQEIVFLDGGGANVELIAHNDLESLSHDSHLTIAFETDSVDKAMKKMKRNGIPIDSGPFQPSPEVKFFFITDPSGVTIQIIEEHESGDEV